MITEDAIHQLEEEQKSLIAQKALLAIDTKIQLWEKDMNVQKRMRDSKQRDYKDYCNLAAKLELHTELDEVSFRGSAHWMHWQE